MKTTRRRFLQATAATAAVKLPGLGAGSPIGEVLDGHEIAGRHKIVRDHPTPNFFEGMLLGNGDVGVCATVRPDGLALHLGKSDSWDIRVSEDHYQEVLTFAEMLKLWERASEEAKRQGKPDMLSLESNIDFFQEYAKKVNSSYGKPWPRPWPCGIVLIHWDPRWVRLIRQTLDPSSGLLTIELDYNELTEPSRSLRLTCFVDWETGLLSVSSPDPVPFHSVAYYPYGDQEAGLPAGSLLPQGAGGPGEFYFEQRFPATPPTDQTPHPPPSPKDRSLSLCARLGGSWTAKAAESNDSGSPVPGVIFQSDQRQPLRLDLLMLTSRDRPDCAVQVRHEVNSLSALLLPQLQQRSQGHWQEFWSRSAVDFEDKALERIWYHNQYFLACCLREGKVAPGLFGNWTSDKIGTAWHGDYHMNYNTQQVYWGVFSSNHVEQHLPYVELCENLLPMSEAYARDKFQLPGAFFPHSAYPVPSQVMPYPVPPWGYEICETPWTVQSLWWHYRYTLDKDFLKRAYPILRAATRFLVAYVKKGTDGKYNIMPTVSPENWGFTVDWRLNKNCIMDLALTEFLLDGTAEASRILDLDGEERSHWAEVRANLAPYPKARGPHGEVWLDIENAPVEYIYNVPVTLAPVFPGEQVGLGQHEEKLEIARRTAETVRLEGGNDLVYQPLIRARLGMLDLHGFKREVEYCLLPNGIANDRVRQSGGRYDDLTDFDFMMHMGVWTENLSLPAVLNECLLQSYTGTIRVFPNRQNLGRVRFRDLRAVGAFLVSADFDGQNVSGVTIHSEKGATLRMENPWGTRKVRVTRVKERQPVEVREEGKALSFPTQAGVRYHLVPA